MAERRKKTPRRKISEAVPDGMGISIVRAPKGKPSAYGEARPICTNAGCVLRKKAKCFGFEGCPGFKGA